MPTPTQVSGPKVRRLFWDIETSPNLCFSWRIGSKINLSHDNIVHERKIICIAYKWEGERKVTVLKWDRYQDDKAMLKQFVGVAAQADELVAHYGDNFDMPWFRARCLINRLTPLPSYKTVDTKAWASKYFYFNSNKLDYLGSILGNGKKLHTDYDLWKRIVLNKDDSALRYMMIYCARDVKLLEKVWSDLRFCVAPKTHAGVVSGHAKWTCPHCGSSNVRLSKTKVSSSGTVSYQMFCPECKSYYTISAATYSEYLKKKRKK